MRTHRTNNTQHTSRNRQTDLPAQSSAGQAAAAEKPAPLKGGKHLAATLALWISSASQPPGKAVPLLMTTPCFTRDMATVARPSGSSSRSFQCSRLRQACSHCSLQQSRAQHQGQGAPVRKGEVQQRGKAILSMGSAWFCCCAPLVRRICMPACHVSASAQQSMPAVLTWACAAGSLVKPAGRLRHGHPCRRLPLPLDTTAAAAAARDSSRTQTRNRSPPQHQDLLSRHPVSPTWAHNKKAPTPPSKHASRTTNAKHS